MYEMLALRFLRSDDSQSAFARYVYGTGSNGRINSVIELSAGMRATLNLDKSPRFLLLQCRSLRV
jgi:hypothetical protein